MEFWIQISLITILVFISLIMITPVTGDDPEWTVQIGYPHQPLQL